MTPFDDPNMVAGYAERPARQVPGLAGLHRMAILLLSEAAGETARMLVVGAGGGLELRAFAEARPGWRFDGVDPSAEMLKLAAMAVGPHAERISLHEGLVDVAPQGPFDGATCLLTLHFVERTERLRTLREIRRRLLPGARLVTAHHSVPAGAAERRLWLSRSAAFAAVPEIDPDKAREAAAAMAEHLPLLSPQEDEALLAEAGFSTVSLFYAGFSFRGWVSTA